MTASRRAEALYDQANALLSRGRLDEAVSHYRQALDLDPDFPEAHTNLANVLVGQGRLDEARGHYERTLALGLDHPMVHYNLGNLLKAQGSYQAAIDAYHRALELEPAYAEAFNNLANALRALERYEAAADAYLAALAIRPDYGAAHSNLAALLYLLCQAGGTTAARRWALSWLERHPGNPIAQHIGTALACRDLPARASADYIRQTFDHFAPEFDERLVSLGYRGPALIEAGLTAEFPEFPGIIRGMPGGGRFEVLDAGCGTGLCAPLLRPLARRLTGVDLSPGMLERARGRGLYDHLEEADLATFLATVTAPAYDLVVATDVLCYFGGLDTILRLLAMALKPGGRLLFTLERVEAEADGDYAINPHGRYSHKEAYVRRALAAAGLVIGRFDPEVLRHEGGRPVTGLFGLVRRA